jgi:superoxide reductase
MAKNKQIYKCDICGNIVEVVNEGRGGLSCCSEEMKLISENSTEAAVEKHIPVINIKDDSIEVSVGSTIHPMDEKHYIQWVELVSKDKIYRHEFKPTDEPKTVFKVDPKSDFYVRAYCNLHGLWKGDK